MILIDIGSSTTKTYRLENDKLEHLGSTSLHLKKDFDPSVGLKFDLEQELYQIINKFIDKYPEEDFRIYGTAVFRQMSDSVRQNFLAEFNDMTGFDLNIISHEAENDYMLSALINKCNLSDPLLVLNIGGGSTEISIIENGDVIESYNIDVGVGTLLSEFENINDEFSGASLKTVVDFINDFLPINNSKTTVGFYTGGELTYMQRADYKLKENSIFKDNDHPLMINYDNFVSNNEVIFNQESISDLQSLMPENPKWMLGARACSALAQAIFQQFCVKFIIPSDSNLMHGIVRKDFL